MPPIGNPILAASHLARSFGGVQAVRDVTLQVHAGEILGLLGPNGAGKTTTVQMLSGLLKPDAGAIEIAQDGSGRAPLGVAPQGLVIWEHLTCKEQLVLVARLHDLPGPLATRRAMELLHALGLADRADRLAHTLSGGMQRRLNIALALVHDPLVALLDEPQAGLDPQSRVLVRDWLGQVKSRTAILLVTHDMDEAERLADRVCIVDHGEVIAQGTVDQLRAGAGGSDVAELELADAEGAAALAKSLGGEPGVGACAVDGVRLSFATSLGWPSLARAADLAQRQGQQIAQVRMRRTTLEDVFIHLTGRALRS